MELIPTIVFRGKEYSVDALKAIANQGVVVKVNRDTIDGVLDTAELSVALDTVIIVQSNQRYDHVFGKLQEDQQNKGEAKALQAVRLFSTYSLKKALLSNVLALQEPVSYVPPTRSVVDRKPYQAKRW